MINIVRKIINQNYKFHFKTLNIREDENMIYVEGDFHLFPELNMNNIDDIISSEYEVSEDDNDIFEINFNISKNNQNMNDEISEDNILNIKNFIVSKIEIENKKNYDLIKDSLVENYKYIINENDILIVDDIFYDDSDDEISVEDKYEEILKSFPNLNIVLLTSLTEEFEEIYLNEKNQMNLDNLLLILKSTLSSKKAKLSLLDNVIKETLHYELTYDEDDNIMLDDNNEYIFDLSKVGARILASIRYSEEEDNIIELGNIFMNKKHALFPGVLNYNNSSVEIYNKAMYRDIINNIEDMINSNMSNLNNLI